jgi:hypothetical protein
MGLATGVGVLFFSSLRTFHGAVAGALVCVVVIVVARSRLAFVRIGGCVRILEKQK